MEELNNIKKAFDTFCEEMEKVFGKSSEEKLEEKLEFEDHNFRIDSTGWVKKTDDNGQDYLENPEGDVWELINCEDSELNGEQLFTWDAMMRETKGKRVPTDEEFDIMLKEKDDMPNIKYVGHRSTVGSSFGGLGALTLWWSSSQSSATYSWRRHLYRDRSDAYRYSSNKLYGFSVRCIKEK
jgi:hypothetical protein